MNESKRARIEIEIGINRRWMKITNIIKGDDAILGRTVVASE